MIHHILYELPRPIIFAHRGSSAYAPENTLASFELALKQNAPAIELDAKLTKDQQIVIFHDPTTVRTTGFKSTIKGLTLSELKQLDAGSHFDPAFQGERIPTLEEVFESVGGKILINVELTNYVSPLDPLPNLVAHLVQKHKLEKWVFFSSFNPIALYRIKSLLPEIPVALLAESGSKGWLARSNLMNWLHHQAIHPYYKDISSAFISSQQKRSRMINVYTVNFAEDMKRCFELGVDGIFTDDPLLAQQTLQTLNHS